MEMITVSEQSAELKYIDQCNSLFSLDVVFQLEYVNLQCLPVLSHLAEDNRSCLEEFRILSQVSNAM